MWLSPRCSVVSVCVKWRWKTNHHRWRSQVSLCSLAMHLPNDVLLHHWCCSIQDAALWGSVWEKDRRRIIIDNGFNSHCVHLQCSCQTLCSFGADVIASNIQCYECLREIEIVGEWSSGMHLIITVFTCNALAKSCAPSSLMLFRCRSSVVSVCVK